MRRSSSTFSFDIVDSARDQELVRATTLLPPDTYRRPPLSLGVLNCGGQQRRTDRTQVGVRAAEGGGVARGEVGLPLERRGQPDDGVAEVEARRRVAVAGGDEQPAAAVHRRAGGRPDRPLAVRRDLEV